MSSKHYYNLCCRYRGRAVEIRTREGRIHRGIIQHVDHHQVYLQPLGGARGIGGFSYGFGGYGGYGRPGAFGLGIALGAIGTLVLLPLFFW